MRSQLSEPPYAPLWTNIMIRGNLYHSKLLQWPLVTPSCSSRSKPVIPVSCFIILYFIRTRTLHLLAYQNVSHCSYYNDDDNNFDIGWRILQHRLCAFASRIAENRPSGKKKLYFCNVVYLML